MSKSSKTGKRIVSKGEYVKAKSKKTGLFIVAAIICALACTCLILSVSSGTDIPGDYWITHLDKMHPFLCYCLLLLLLVLSGRLFIVAKNVTTFAMRQESVPLTRANTAELPASNSLVRASAPPVQEPQAVLLRAATETQERHEEQLVRASAGGTE
jgi:hypothetical protein